jgi:RHS repeat-associated protein
MMMKNTDHWLTPALISAVYLLGSIAAHCFWNPEGRGDGVAVADSPDAKAVSQCLYGASREVIRATGPMAQANPFRFSTKYRDGETGLAYYGYRYYNASTGRWLSRDPLSEQAFTTFSVSSFGADPDMSVYLFVNNNAISDIDWLGESVWNGPVCFCTYTCMINIPVGNYDNTGKPIMDGGAICDASNVGKTAWRSGHSASCASQPWVLECLFLNYCAKKTCLYACEYKCSRGKASWPRPGGTRSPGKPGYYWLSTGGEKLLSGCKKRP